MRQTTPLAQREQRGGGSRWVKHTHASELPAPPPNYELCLTNTINLLKSDFFCLISLAAYLQITMLPLSFCRCVQPAAHGCPTIAMNATTDLLMWMIMSIGGYKIKWLDTSKDKPNSWVSFWNCFLCWKGQGEVSHHCLQRQASFHPCPQVATIVTFPWQDSRSAYKVDLC